MKKSAVIALLLASVSAIRMGDTPPGEEKDADAKPADNEKPKKEVKEKDLGPPPDKVSTLEPVINREHTTFYAQSEPRLAAVFFDKAAGVWR